MKVNVHTMLSSIAICVSAVAVFYSAEVSKRISSSDHRAAEQVKSDTARLYSSVYSIAEKWAFDVTGERNRYDISREREVLLDFVNSESAIAYRAWIGQYGARRNEKWRVFFASLGYLSQPQISDIGCESIQDVLTLLASLTAHDIERITQYNSDLAKVTSSDLAKENVIGQYFTKQHCPKAPE